MNFKPLFTLNAIIAALFGAGFLLLPATVLVFVGTTDYTISTLLTARFLGGALLMAGLLLWFIKDSNDFGLAQKSAYLAFTSTIVGFVLTMNGVAGSEAVIRSKAWLLIVIHVVFALGYAYLLFLAPKNNNSRN